jgi:hypothetical protein
MIEYPIKRGTELDAALDELVTRMVSGPVHVGPYHDDININSRTHLLALSVRRLARKAGLEPDMLPPVLIAAWYGQHPDGKDELLFEQEMDRMLGRAGGAAQ